MVKTTNPVQQYLEDYVSMTKYLKRSRYNGWSSTSEFVLKHGREWNPSPLPDGIKPMKLKECFRNAANLAIGFRRNELIYCEGYALSMIPMPHAWCIDLEGNVIDPTWAVRRNGLSPVGSAYYGIAFKSCYLAEALSNQKHYGLIDAWEESWPLLRAPVDDWKHPIHGKLA